MGDYYPTGSNGVIEHLTDLDVSNSIKFQGYQQINTNRLYFARVSLVESPQIYGDSRLSYNSYNNGVNLINISPPLQSTKAIVTLTPLGPVGNPDSDVYTLCYILNSTSVLEVFSQKNGGATQAGFNIIIYDI
jgi:hypothetical protein